MNTKGAEARALLNWYDEHARDLPWRVGPSARKAGHLPDPYRVWLSEIMLQQTTVATVKAYFERFTALWPTVEALAAAEDDAVLGEWAGLGYYARARNLIKCARMIATVHDGIFPDQRDRLLALPGIGPYTAAAIASIAFERSETVVDGNVERVVSRLFRVEMPLPKAKAKLAELATALTPEARPGDYAQAMMDLGATVCTPKSPSCEICPLQDYCAGFAHGDSARYPRKEAKKPKPKRHGFMFVGQTQSGGWILEKRPESGLLGGMLGWPGSDWSDAPEHRPPYEAAWAHVGEVQHVFTHFHLTLQVFRADHIKSAPENAVVRTHNAFRASDLPTVMRKAFDLAQSHRDTSAIPST